jgi:DMSO/TMAO reductase YedYZ molybdopterin-dependent catalytic subunit
MALGVAELVGALIEVDSPVVAVGGWVIDHVPSFVKDFAIETFGTNDKPALIVGVLVLLALFAAGIGVVARRRRRVGVAAVALFGLLGAAAALTRPFARVADAVPALVGAIAGAAVLLTLLGSSRRAPASDRDASEGTALAVDRRRFLLSAAGAGVVAAGAGGIGRAVRNRFSVAADRAAIVLPTPASPAAPLPAGAELGVSSVTPFITSNADFYRIDTALVAPQLRPASWRLRVGGMVDRPLTLTYQDLLDRPLVERDLTLICVSNEVGGRYTGTARWLGVPLRDVLLEAGVQPGADQLVSRSSDGWTAGTPTQVVLDGRDALIAIGMNGDPLPVSHGFPARLVVPGLYGFVSATKWLTELELSTFADFDPYWARRGWAKQAPVKTMARIDTPRGLAKLPAGPTAIAGMAWATHRGIDAVEVAIDDGPWLPARLGDVPSTDTWRQWALPWDAPPGRHTLTVRATDGDGVPQTADRAEPIPNGASGWHSIVVIVT